MIIKNEKGVVYPVALLVASIAFLVIFEASLIYVSQLGYVTEIKNYYQREIKESLAQKSKMPKDDAHLILDYNLYIDSNVEMKE
ncbi:hypothetical protein [Lederbergia citrea]|uniref:Uncharacterized protein n=1 Tax=Lederbergia citrea TaxID=2833581 RepID=A0A942UP12_9BACI|nr:hypothetical protein [Lederbergia citrea]MBS4176356.1 hypothetical protein [Lederbergia citrea]MBS4202917.1 hypothetical protein [Lederbergia citrea]MBS4222416.1 hypothetical protein [Lederbergia citrea]